MPEVLNGNLHINDALILRDCELFHRKYGYGFFNKKFCDKYGGQIPMADEPRSVWLPTETQELKNMISRGESVLMVGDLGAGKSALLYGLRAMYREEGVPYCYIDGHFMSTPVKKLESAMAWAARSRMILCWDSLDYLTAKSRRIRKYSTEVHRYRSNHLLEVINDFIDLGQTFVATSHSQPWLNKYGDPEILGSQWLSLTQKLPVHQVRGVFDSPEEIVHFYVQAGFPAERALYLSSLQNHPTLQEIRDSLSCYRIAKLVALDQNSLSVQIRAEMDRFFSGAISEDQFLGTLTKFVILTNQETARRMGVNF